MAQHDPRAARTSAAPALASVLLNACVIMSRHALPSFLAFTIPLALFALGCGSRIAPPPTGGGGNGDLAFPVGTYTSCAEGASVPGGPFLNAAGFEGGAVLTLTQNGDTVTAEYVDENGKQSSFDFTVATGVHADLASPGQSISAGAGQCVHGPGNVGNFPATITASAGSLAYDANTAFVSIVGTAHAEAGDCGSLSAPATFWIACGNGPDAPPAPPRGNGTGVTLPQLPAGTYACTSQVEAHANVAGHDQYVTSGGHGGTLTVMQSGPQVTAQYAGDSSIDGTLSLTPATGTSAIAEAGQGFSTQCLTPISEMGGLPPPTPAPMDVPAASLGVFDSTLLLPFYGTMGGGSACSGAQMAGSLICTKQ